MRLLLAEDERALSKALATILERSNYSVDTVYDGEAALEYLAADNYDGVILDIMMPKKDGITVLKELRSRGSKIPVLILTAKSEVDDKVLGLDSGANDYLTKPFHSRELLARIRAMTRAQSSQTSSVLQDGQYHPGSAHLRALVPHRQLPAGEPGVPDPGAADAEPWQPDLR